jgi:predicted nucleic acid-binding protein
VIAYIDTSALLRIVLRESGALDELRTYDGLVSSELIAVESARTIDRLRLQGSLTTEEAAARLRTINQWLEAIDLVLLRTPVLSRASEPMPTSLGTLDTLHLATALIWRDRMGALPMMATHDTALGQAAQAFGFEVRGI